MAVTALSDKLKKILNGTLPGGVIGQVSERYGLGTIISNIITLVNTNETTAGAAIPKAAFTTAGRILEATGAGTYAEVSAVPRTISAAINFNTATGPIATIPAGQVWQIHRVWFRTTTDWDGNGTVAIGDGNDPDGFLALSNTALDPAYDESGGVTGWTTGSAGLKDGGGAQNCAGVYQWDGTNDERLQMLYAPSGSAETIDATVTTGTSTAGAGVCYIQYTRIA